MSGKETNEPGPHIRVRPDWLAQRQEEILEPNLAIVDAHHHLFWDRPDRRYLLFEFLGDISDRHNIRATVFVECRAMYRADGDPRLKSLGETEFANGVAAMGASGLYGDTRVCAGIVGKVDLVASGDRSGAELEAHVAAAPTRFRGIRNISAWHADPAARGTTADPPPGMLQERSFRQGFAHLGRLGLSFDAWMYHTQLSELADLAGAFPETMIVLNHAGGPIGIGPYAGRRDAVFGEWLAGMQRLAEHDNVTVKVGGFGMRLFGFGFENGALPPSSSELAEAWGPYVEECISAFGVQRCMFEGNFPVDKGTCSYDTIWNTFKRIVASYSADEKAHLFHGTATRVYRLAGI